MFGFFYIHLIDDISKPTNEMKIITVDDFNSKNPLSVVLGIFMRIERNKKGETVKNVSEKMELGDSYYRMIESGSANLHPSKAFLFYKLFGDTIVLDFGKISKYLTGIQIIESKFNNNDDVNIKLETLLSSEDNDFKSLCDGINLLTKSKSSDQDYYNLLLNFFDSLKDYLPTEIQNHFLIEQLKTLPSVYFDIVSNTIDELLYLPFILGNKSVWQWEKRNQKFLKEQICLTNRPESISSEENLREYKYWHLWSDGFKKIKMIVISDKYTKKQIENQFKKNLKAALEADKETIKLKKFDEAISKMEIKVISRRYKSETINELLDYSQPVTDYENSQIRNMSFDAVWVWTMSKDEKSKYNVGFLADIIYENDNKLKNLAETMISLDFNKVSITLKELNRIWEE